VFKPALKNGFHALIEKKLGNKNRKMVYGKTKEERVKTIAVEAAAQELFCISDEMALQLSKWILLIEDHYSAKKGADGAQWILNGLLMVLAESYLSFRPGPKLYTPARKQE
jgi:pyruvate,water dikinase